MRSFPLNGERTIEESVVTIRPQTVTRWPTYGRPKVRIESVPEENDVDDVACIETQNHIQRVSNI